MTKEEDLLLRVFALIKDNHFTDFKMVPDYIKDIRFKRQLGTEIANYVRGKFPEAYHKERRGSALVKENVGGMDNR